MAVKHKPGMALPWACGPWINSEGKGVYVNIGNSADRVAAVSVYGRKRDDGQPTFRTTKNFKYKGLVPQETANANAEYIVHAVNAYPKLVDTLQTIIHVCSEPLADLAAIKKLAGAVLTYFGESDKLT